MIEGVNSQVFVAAKLKGGVLAPLLHLPEVYCHLLLALQV